MARSPLPTGSTRTHSGGTWTFGGVVHDSSWGRTATGGAASGARFFAPPPCCSSTGRWKTRTASSLCSGAQRRLFAGRCRLFGGCSSPTLLPSSDSLWNSGSRSNITCRRSSVPTVIVKWLGAGRSVDHCAQTLLARSRTSGSTLGLSCRRSLTTACSGVVVVISSGNRIDRRSSAHCKPTCPSSIACVSQFASCDCPSIETTFAIASAVSTLQIVFAMTTRSSIDATRISFSFLTMRSSVDGTRRGGRLFFAARPWTSSAIAGRRPPPNLRSGNTTCRRLRPVGFTVWEGRESAMQRQLRHAVRTTQKTGDNLSPRSRPKTTPSFPSDVAME